jgi:very-short-patch-repair endonuclease
MAAALYYRGDGLVSGNAAACVWGQLDSTRQLRDRDPIRVLLVGRNGMEPEGISLHRARTVARQDVRWRHGIPLTSPARTLLDLAATVDDLELESALLASLRKNLVRRSSLIDVVDRNPRAKGIGVIRQLLASVTSLHDTRSIYERKLLALLRAADLPLPLTNAMVAGKVVDGVWPDLKLIYEFDGWEYHRDKFESDRLRDQGMLAAGHQVLRISGRQIDREPYALIARFASTMAGLKLRSSS